MCFSEKEETHQQDTHKCTVTNCLGKIQGNKLEDEPYLIIIQMHPFSAVQQQLLPDPESFYYY